MLSADSHQLAAMIGARSYIRGLMLPGKRSASEESKTYTNEHMRTAIRQVPDARHALVKSFWNRQAEEAVSSCLSDGAVRLGLIHSYVSEMQQFSGLSKSTSKGRKGMDSDISQASFAILWDD